MNKIIGIRKETKYVSERRAAITPEHAKKIVSEHNIDVLVQPSEQRIFPDSEYVEAGAKPADDLSRCDFIFGVKEVPIEDMIENKPYLFFSHTIKAQSYNMPLLKAILEKNITLFDYELVKNEKGQRLIFFGRFAGYAGTIDSLWLLGEKYLSEGIKTPFAKLKQAINYNSLEEAKEAVKLVGEEIKENGLPGEVVPIITGFTGYGNVSKGAQSIYDLLPVIELKANELSDFIKAGKFSNKAVYKIEFKEVDMYKHTAGSGDFDFNYFVNHPKEYKSIFEQYLPNLTMLINGIYWTPEFERHVTKQSMKRIYNQDPSPKLKVIGDITCDIGGSIEMTVKAAKSANPCYVYKPLTDKVIDGWEGNGPVILAVDILPAELPRESSKSFGDELFPFIPALANADYSKPYEELNLPKEFLHAIIAHKGKLTKDFKYLEEHLPE